MDLAPVRYQTYDDLLRYCYRVASAVGLVSIEVFGYRNPATQRYAIELGYALQLTNILRDVAKDLANGGRIYLPLDDLARFGIDPDELAQCKGDPRFRELMAFEAERAEARYVRAVAELPPEDRRSMAAAEMMRRVYHRILEKMRRDGFRVFEKQYRLSKLEKLGIITRVLLLGR
jgi:15-cis-phytoene synthase